MPHFVLAAPLPLAVTDPPYPKCAPVPYPPPLYLIKETIMHQNSARSEDRTHDLQIALIILIMRLTRYLLRYPGTYAPRSGKTIYIPLTVIDHLS